VRIEVVPTPREFGGADPDTAVIVVDVFRACTTITAALANDAKYVLPTADVEQAVKLAEPYADSEVVLGGERDCRRIEGFQLGNSPREYTREAVGNKVVIFTTTNGTGALFSARDAGAVLVGCFLNFSRVAAAVNQWPRVVVLCAGNDGRLSLEDFVCAGGLVDRLVRSLRQTSAPGLPAEAGTARPRRQPLSPALDLGASGPQLDDGAFAAWAAYHETKRDLGRLLVSTEHALRLSGLGFEADLEFALRIDSVPVVPKFSDGRIEVRPA